MESVSFIASLINSANFFTAGLYVVNSDGSTTNIETQGITKGSGYITPFSITFTSTLSIGTVYRTILWENGTVGTLGGASRCAGDLPYTATSTTVRANDELIVDSTAGLSNGASTYVNATYIGWNIWLERVGSGTMFQMTSPVDYTYDNTTGTITLAGSVVFNSGERYVVHFYPEIVTASAPPASLISSGRIITADTTLTSADLNTALILQSASATLNITLPTSIPDWKRIYLYSMGGMQINVSILCQGTDKIQYTSQVTSLIIGRGETLEMYKAFGFLNVANALPGVDNVGQLLEGYVGTDANTIPANGALLIRAQYPRLWAKAQTLSPVSDSVWGGLSGGEFINKGFYSTGTVLTGAGANFRVPDLTVYGFRRGNVGAGVYQAEMIGPHNHLERVYQAVNNGGVFPVGFSGITGTPGSSGGVTTENNLGTENRPANTGVVILIRT